MSRPTVFGSLKADSIEVGSDGQISTVTLKSASTLTTGTAKDSWVAPRDFEIIGDVYAHVGTAPTGATLIADLNIAGTTVFTTQSGRPTIAISGTDDTATPEVVAGTAGQTITLDIDQIGSSVAGANMVVTFVVKYTN